MKLTAKTIGSRTVRVAAIVGLLGTTLVVAAPSTSAAPVTKTLGATCEGVDPVKDGALIKVLDPSGRISIPIDVSVDAPATLLPEQADVPVKYGFSVTLDGNTTKSIPASIPSVNISNLKFGLAVSGPTETKSLLSPPLPAQDLPVTAGQPASIAFGPFDGAFTGIGKGGVIKVSVAETAFTIKVNVGGEQTVNVKCFVPGTAFRSKVKIPGSPDIAQPIEVNAQPSEKVAVDVLGQFTTATKDDKGVLREVDASSFKVLDGPGAIVNGKLEVTAGAAGSITTVTCEVCSGSLPGVNEVQTLLVDSDTQIFRKGIGFTLKVGDAVSPVIPMVPPIIPFPNLPPVAPPSNPDAPTQPTPWEQQANNFILAPHEMPTPQEVQTALELTPGIGPGNVSVTRDPASDPPPSGPDRPKKWAYRIEFIGALAQTELKENQKVKVGTWYSVFPQEVLSKIVAAASSLGGGGDEGEGGGPTTTTTPEQLQAKINQLQVEVDAALDALQVDVALQKKIEQALLELQKPDVQQAALNFINSLFTEAPGISVATAGEAPTGICTEADIDVLVAGDPLVGGINETSSPSGLGGTKLAFTG